MSASINQGYIFGSTELVTNTKLGLLVNDSVITLNVAESELDIASAPQTNYLMRYDGSKMDWVAQQSLASISSSTLSNAEIGFIIDGGGDVPSVGSRGYVEIPFNCSIQSVSLLANATGMAQIDIWKDTYANFPPTVADSISLTKPSFNGASKFQDSSLMSWNASIASGSILKYNVESLASITSIGIYLKVLK